MVIAVPPGDVRGDLGGGELTHHLTEVLMVGAQLEHPWSFPAPARWRGGIPPT